VSKTVTRERQKKRVDSGGSGRYRGAAWGASEFPTTIKEVRKPNRLGNLSEAPTGTERRAGLVWRVFGCRIVGFPYNSIG